MSIEEFRAKLADAVTVAINTGTRIAPYNMDGNEPGENCPLGCFVGLYRFPTSLAGIEIGIGTANASAFINAFDNGPTASNRHGLKPEALRYSDLGAAYRRRFVEGVKP